MSIVNDFSGFVLLGEFENSTITGASVERTLLDSSLPSMDLTCLSQDFGSTLQTGHLVDVPELQQRDEPEAQQRAPRCSTPMPWRPNQTQGFMPTSPINRPLESNQVNISITPFIPSHAPRVDPELLNLKQEALSLGFTNPADQIPYITSMREMRSNQNRPSPVLPQTTSSGIMAHSPKLRLGVWKTQQESWEIFVHRFERYAMDLQWDDTTKLLQLVSCLEGKALSIYHRLGTDR